MTETLIAMGLVGIAIIVFLETGFFIGVFLPGDSLLLLGGFLAAQDYFSIYLLVGAVILATVLGYQLGFFIGAYAADWLKCRPDGKIYKRKYLLRGIEVYQRFGAFSVLGGRFIPVVRSFVPLAAGVSRMSWKTFLLLNLLGAVIWGTLLPFIGFFAGEWLPHIKHGFMIAGGIVLIVLVYAFVRRFCHAKSTKPEEK